LRIFDSPEIITYFYHFLYHSGIEKKFQINIERKSLNLIQETKIKPPLWARMKNFKCPHCTLDEKTTHCPLAVALSNIIDTHKESCSFEKIYATIKVEERTYSKHTALQDALSSLIGIYMVTSGCPHTAKLKPMVRFHLPFATLYDTEYRVTSMYLLAQYFIYKKGENPDCGLKNLALIYDNIRKVNINVSKRLKELKIKDASINAVAILNCFANSMTFSIESDVFHEMEQLFSVYYYDTENK